MVRGCGVPMKALPAPQTFTLREKKCELRYPLELLCSVASTHCLGSVACHELITLKHTALLSLSEDGWAKIEKDTRLGLLALGRSWIGWHGFGRRLFFLYLMDRARAARHGVAGIAAEEFDPALLTEYQTSLGYHLCLALTPKYVKVFNCKNRLKSCEFVNDGDAEIAQLAGRSALLCAREFVAHCLQIYVLHEEATTATTQDYKYLIIFPLGARARGGPQLIGVIFFLPCDVADLDMATPRGVRILGLVAAGLQSFGLPFKGVVIHDLADVIYAALTAPAYSEVNCEASGVLSGTMDLTSSLMRYESSHFKVTRIAVDKYLVTIRGVDVGTGEVRYAEDYPSDLINADLVVADVKSYLLFNHAAKAPAEERESVQVEGMAKCVKSLRRPLQELVDALYRNRVRAMPKAPAEHAGSTFEESIQGLFRELPWWHKKHPKHDKRGTKMMRMYKSKVVGIAPISSDACARIWCETVKADEKATRTWHWQRGRTLADIKSRVQFFWKDPNAKPPEPLEAVPQPTELLDDDLDFLDDDFAAASD
ncbi:hypothetical protein JL722_11183 [Aureococcus anophagefferens]|nr:hypothetical protein JL722_11183 [Aureococcus anophagefferens]